MTKGAQVDGGGNSPFAKALMQHLWSAAPPSPAEPMQLAVYVQADPSSAANTVLFLVPSAFALASLDFGTGFVNPDELYFAWHAGARAPVGTVSHTKCLQLFGRAWCRNDTTPADYPDLISRYESLAKRVAKRKADVFSVTDAPSASHGSPVARLF
jgi:hypothetical protein